MTASTQLDFLKQFQLQKQNLQWLLDNPHFEQKPASIMEFLGPGYLDIESKVRVGLKKALVEIFGQKVGTSRIAVFERAMFTGGIGIGKTTLASIALPYMAHWVLCLKDPQAYFELLLWVQNRVHADEYQ